MVAFEETTIKSFGAVKSDMDEFRRSMNEWIIFLDGTVRDLKMQVLEMEKRVAELEERQDMQWRN